MQTPKWHKPRAGLGIGLAFGACVAGVAVSFGEPAMIQIAPIPAGLGLGIYGIDCALHKVIRGEVRPSEVLRADARAAAWAVAFGFGLGLVAPLLDVSP